MVLSRMFYLCRMIRKFKVMSKFMSNTVNSYAVIFRKITTSKVIIKSQIQVQRNFRYKLKSLLPFKNGFPTNLKKKDMYSYFEILSTGVKIG